MAFIIYRLEYNKTKEGPWTAADNIPGDFFDRFMHVQDVYTNNPTYPGYSEDFPDIYDNYVEGRYRIGMHLPCLFFHWFGFDIDLFVEGFSLYKIEVINMVIGKSGLQCAFRPEDVIKEEKFESFTHLINREYVKRELENKL